MGTVRDALQHPDMRRIEVSYGLSVAVYAASRNVAGMGAGHLSPFPHARGSLARW